MGRAALPLALLLGGCGAAELAPSPSPLVVTSELASVAAAHLAAHVDPSRGVVVVVRVEDASDGEAVRRSSGHRCGAAAIDALAAELATYLAQRRELGVPETWRCEGARCELRGMMEYDPVRALRFGRSAAGEVVVIGLDVHGDAAWDDAQLAALRASLDAEHTALAGPCNGGSFSVTGTR
jgi:hypothetical protein